MRAFLFSLVFILGFQATVHAQENAGDNQASQVFNNYYTVSESFRPSPRDETLNFAVDELFWEAVAMAQSWGLRLYSLVQFDHHEKNYGDVVEPYNRLKHFGTWISEIPKRNCRNTRAQVLVRDSQVPVTYGASGCTVKAGQWDDPYSGKTFTEASDLQIDHLIPLKNAYISGADKWTSAKRCLFANYQGNDFHLLPVLGKENGRKSDRTPAGYMPSDQTFRCQYLAIWLKAKAIWNLGLTPPEKAAVVSLVQSEKCSGVQLSYTVEEIESQRRYIAEHLNICSQ